MFLRCTGSRIVFLLLFCFTGFIAIGQPTLPDIAGAADKGIVILSWNCQYAGVKSITVLRSADSALGYAPIGKVKKLDKGIEAFVDGHPAAGKNYYKLIVQFASGLTWSSNHCTVAVEGTALASPKQLPVNDSLQRYITTGNTVKPGTATTVVTPAAKAVVKDPLSVEPEDGDEPEPAKGKKNNHPDDDDPQPANGKTADNKRKMYISFDMDTVTYKVGTTRPVADTKPAPEHKKVVLAFDEPSTAAPTFIRSLYVFTDFATGHVRINLPADVTTHHYSLKFYDDKNQLIIDVPKLYATQIVMDKRNFQRKGTFKFVLRKDVVELEQGFIIIP